MNIFQYYSAYIFLQPIPTAFHLDICRLQALYLQLTFLSLLNFGQEACQELGQHFLLYSLEELLLRLL